MSPSEAQLHDALHEGEGDGLDVGALIAHAVGVRRARQRRRTVLAGGLVVAGLGAAGLTTLGGPGGVSGHPASGGGDVTTRSSTVGPHMQPGPLYTGPMTPIPTARTCRAADLHIGTEVTRRGSTALIEVALRGVSGPACTLRGYPSVTVTGRRTDREGRAVGPVRRLAVAERHGDVNGHPDRGPHQVVLSTTATSPGDQAFCYLAVRESGSSRLGIDQVRSMTISLPGTGPLPLDGLSSLLVGRVAGHRLLVVATAIAR